MSKYFLPNDYARCDNEGCSKKLKCSRYLDVLPFETYWYSEFKESDECFIEKTDEYENRKRNRQTLQSR